MGVGVLERAGAGDEAAAVAVGTADAGERGDVDVAELGSKHLALEALAAIGTEALLFLILGAGRGTAGGVCGRGQIEIRVGAGKVVGIHGQDLDFGKGGVPADERVEHVFDGRGRLVHVEGLRALFLNARGALDGGPISIVGSESDIICGFAVAFLCRLIL